MSEGKGEGKGEGKSEGKSEGKGEGKGEGKSEGKTCTLPDRRRAEATSGFCASGHALQVPRPRGVCARSGAALRRRRLGRVAEGLAQRQRLRDRALNDG